MAWSGAVLFGGSRNSGLAFAEGARAEGKRVVAMVRADSDAAGLIALGVEIVRGDAMNPADVTAAFAAAKGCDAVVSTIGGWPGLPVQPDYEANRNVVDGAVAAGIKRMVLVTTVGAGDSITAMPERFKAVLGPIAAMKTQAEDHLKASGMAWTILRPGGLESGPATGQVLAAEDNLLQGRIDRADVGACILRALNNDASAGKALSIVNREKVSSRGDAAEFAL